MGYVDKDKQRLFDRIWKRNQRLRHKAKVFALLGNKCARCKISDERVLQLDHIEPIKRDRAKQNNNSGAPIFQKIALGKLDIKLFQLLCANCHQIKTVTEDRLKFKNFLGL